MQHRFQATMSTDELAALLGMPEGTKVLAVDVDHATDQVRIVGESADVQPDEHSVSAGGEVPFARRRVETITAAGRVVSHSESWSV